VIPWRLFFLLCQAMEHSQSADQLSDAQSTALGAALAMNGKDSKVRSAVRRLSRAGYPEVRDEP
jgi:hypothetical protein